MNIDLLKLCVKVVLNLFKGKNFDRTNITNITNISFNHNIYSFETVE